MPAAAIKPVLKERPPIVVVMGHVDHGKTTLLDTIRKMQAGGERVKAIVDTEAGGITQHIGAYEIIKGDKKISFIDTPGHEAFSAMRLRGTSVADIALLVVAADDGVKPQTKEAIEHIKKANIPYIVVINKIDKNNADPEKVKSELAAEDVLLEGRGGKVPVVALSAKEEKDIDELLETIILLAELEELKYDAILPAEGYVLESRRDPRRGITTSIVLTNGTLRARDFLVCGPTYGKVKIMEDHVGKPIKGAIPSSPVTVVGLSGISVAGDPCKVVFVEADAQKEVAKHTKLIEERQAQLRIEPEGQEKVLTILVRADVQGSVEVLVSSLRQIKSEKVGLKIIKCECGVLGEDDIKFAEATKAKIFTFKIDTPKDVLNYARQKKIEIKKYDVIYEFVEGVRKEMTKLLEPEVIKNELGRLNILAIFRRETKRMIVGGKVVSGKIVRGAKVEVLREDEVLGGGKIVELKSGEKKYDEVLKGNKAGIMYEGKVKIEEGDVIVAYEEERVYPDLE